MTWPSVRSVVATSLMLAITACSPQPPGQVPVAPSLQLEPFRNAITQYVTLTEPERIKAAQTSSKVPGENTPTPRAEDAVRTRANTLATALRETLRPSAKQGDLFGDAATIIRDEIRQAFEGPQRDLLMDALSEQNDTGKASSPSPPIEIHQRVDAPRVPPLLVVVLPPLPGQLEYDFVGRVLILRDVDAEVVADFLPAALPEPPPPGRGAPPSSGMPAQSAPPLPMPDNRGSTVFAAIGDSGSGDAAQESIAHAMLTYFTSGRRFGFVLMLGDNLYSDDYTSEFLTPYKPLLDRGVKFHAALGNHDRDLEIHFKPFNMSDRDYYSFDEGNARFVALNSNRPADQAQAKWFETAFADAGPKWRICFFHHPLYSSGQHAGESAQVIRPALEDMLVRAQVNVVFGGHEHLYERVAAQKGVRYFVSDGGGRNLYRVRPGGFDEVAVSEHHFMVLEIDGNRMFFEAVTAAQELLDCGLLFRSTDEAAKPPDKDTQAWLDSLRDSSRQEQDPHRIGTRRSQGFAAMTMASTRKYWPALAAACFLSCRPATLLAQPMAEMQKESKHESLLSETPDTTTQTQELRHAAIRLPMAAALASLLALRPRRRGTPARRPPVIQTQIILAVIGAVVMLVVGSSLARAFGIVGAAGLVRYRAKVEDPKDAGVMLSTLAIGLASGVGLWLLATFGAMFIMALLWVVESFEPVATRRFALKIKSKDPAAIKGRVEEILKRTRVPFELRAVGQEELDYELHWPLERKTDHVSDDILAIDSRATTEVLWEQKSEKN